jgi:hypothetical protein
MCRWLEMPFMVICEALVMCSKAATTFPAFISATALLLSSMAALLHILMDEMRVCFFGNERLEYMLEFEIYESNIYVL